MNIMDDNLRIILMIGSGLLFLIFLYLVVTGFQDLLDQNPEHILYLSNGSVSKCDDLRIRQGGVLECDSIWYGKDSWVQVETSYNTTSMSYRR